MFYNECVALWLFYTKLSLHIYAWGKKKKSSLMLRFCKTTATVSVFVVTCSVSVFYDSTRKPDQDFPEIFLLLSYQILSNPIYQPLR